MALPKLNHTLYEHTLVGLGKTIKYRPFTNQEQKILLLAKESKGSDEESTVILNSIKQIIEKCTLGKISSDELSTFDIEDLFMRIRAKSVGEVVVIKYRYDYKDEDGKPKSRFLEISINTDDVKVVTDPTHDKKIMLSETVGLVMKYPNFTHLANVNDSDDLAIACIDYIFDKDEIYDMSSTTPEELKEFYDDIDTPGLLKIKRFFETMPKLSHSVEVDLGDGQKETVKFEGLKDFFT